MNYMKKVLSMIGVLAIVAAAASFLAPRTTHAVVAALVEVANTPANPVLNRDVDNPDREKPFGFITDCFMQGVHFLICPIDLATVIPAGQRFVITNLSGRIDVAPAGSSVDMRIDIGKTPNEFPTIVSTHLPLLPQGTFQQTNPPATRGAYVGSMPWHVALDPAMTLYLVVDTSSSLGSDPVIELSGYLIDCSTGCATP